MTTLAPCLTSAGVPLGWRTDVRLGDVADIVSGITIGRKVNGQSVRTVPYLAVANVQDRALNLNKVKTVDATEGEIARYSLKKNDLLLTEGGDPDKLGRGTLWDNEIEDCIHQNHIFRVRLTSTEVNHNFLNWLISSQYGKDYFLRSAKQTTGIATINLGQLRNFPLLLPPLDEQRRIAEVLDRAEALRAKRRAALAQLDELKHSIFVQMFGDPRRNPKGWPTTKLNELLAVPLRNGLSPSTTGDVVAKVLTLSSITGDKFDESAYKESRFNAPPPSDQSVDASDLLICRGNGAIRLVGKGFFPSRSLPDVTFPDTIIAARINRNRVDPDYLQHLWNSPAVRVQIESLARTTNGTFKVNQTMLEGIDLVTPPLDLQRAYSSKQSSLTNLRAAHVASLFQLEGLFAALQHRGFRGELWRELARTVSP